MFPTVEEEPVANDSKLPKPRVTPSLLLGSAAVIGALALAVHLADMDKGFSITVGTDGTAKIDVSASDSFSDVLAKALTKEPDVVDAILVGKQYYKLTDGRIVAALASAKSMEIADGLRKQLWNLDWPFNIPGTLRGADGRLLEALDDLDNELQDSQAKEANELLASLWIDMIEQQSIFKQRSFKASLQVVPGAHAGSEKTRVVYACPGSALASGRIIQLVIGGNSVWAEVKQNPSIFDCDGETYTVRQMLAGRNAKLGLSKAVLKDLVRHDPNAGAKAEKGQALFVVYPREMVGAISK